MHCTTIFYYTNFFNLYSKIYKLVYSIHINITAIIVLDVMVNITTVNFYLVIARNDNEKMSFYFRHLHIKNDSLK